ncbi:MAG: hypothetical protein J7J98_06830 [candidate division Zixibacteria bacterium]|nr:hypothetical protein [candidate division Zixibacteria bacterium]
MNNIREKSDGSADATLVATFEGVRLEQTPQSLAMFVNWSAHDREFPTCNLLDDVDFANYKLIFFDPHRFAIANRLLSPEAEISDVNYVSFKERDFVHYLSGVKRVAASLTQFLGNGGLLVIRSNIPKSHIKVRKRSSTGTRKYTESVISSFFWLEDILGVYSLTYCQAKTLRYLNPKNPLHGVFGKSGIHCVQTLNSTSKAQMEVIATSGSSTNAAAISRLSFDTIPGQIYLVPQFLIKGETAKMVEAFKQIAASAQSGSLRPSWLDYYEKQVRDFSPFRSKIDEVEIKMEALKKQLASLIHKQDVYDDLPHLLFESEGELEIATRTALEILGFTCLQPTSNGKASAFEVHPANDKSVRLMVRATHSESGPILVNQVTALQTAIENRTSAIKAKGMLVGNAARYTRPEQRHSWFDEPSTKESKRSDICLMPSLVLFTMACYVMTRHDAENIDALKTSLRRDIIDCDSVFVLSRKKYAI